MNSQVSTLIIHHSSRGRDQSHFRLSRKTAGIQIYSRAGGNTLTKSVRFSVVRFTWIRVPYRRYTAVMQTEEIGSVCE